MTDLIVLVSLVAVMSILFLGIVLLVNIAAYFFSALKGEKAVDAMPPQVQKPLVPKGKPLKAA